VILLDTHIWIWWVRGVPTLSADTRRLLDSADSTGVGVSAISCWEVAKLVERGLRFLLNTQLEDGTWHVRRRAFPFQPTMDSHFPHGRDGWISAAGTSWAVMALSLTDDNEAMAAKPEPKRTALNR